MKHSVFSSTSSPRDVAIDIARSETHALCFMCISVRVLNAWSSSVAAYCQLRIPVFYGPLFAAGQLNCALLFPRGKVARQ